MGTAFTDVGSLGGLACPEEAEFKLWVLSSCKTRCRFWWVCGPDDLEIRGRWERPYRISVSELYQDLGEPALLVGWAWVSQGGWNRLSIDGDVETLSFVSLQSREEGNEFGPGETPCCSFRILF